MAATDSRSRCGDMLPPLCLAYEFTNGHFLHIAPFKLIIYYFLQFSSKQLIALTSGLSSNETSSIAKPLNSGINSVSLCNKPLLDVSKSLIALHTFLFYSKPTAKVSKLAVSMLCLFLTIQQLLKLL